MEQHKIAGLQGLDRLDAAQQVLRRQAFEHHGRAGFERDAIGQLAHAFGGHHALFAIAAGRHAGVGRAVAHLQVRDALAHGLDHARSFHAQLQWHGVGVQAGALVDVNEVQADGLVTDADLAGAGLPDGHINKFHDFGTTGLVNLNGLAHGFAPECR